MELEKIALNDEYFVSRKLYPNIDFYSGITLRAMGFPTSMFTVLFAVARTVGWIAQWTEMMEDASQKIGRPRQVYTGAPQRDYVPIGKRALERAVAHHFQHRVGGDFRGRRAAAAHLRERFVLRGGPALRARSAIVQQAARRRRRCSRP